MEIRAPAPWVNSSVLMGMQRCPRCERWVAAEGAFCPHCGAQLQVQPVKGDIIDGTQRFKKNKGMSPGRAARLSIIPGLGHLYAGAPAKGLVFFAAIAVPLLIGTALDLTVVVTPVG